MRQKGKESLRMSSRGSKEMLGEREGKADGHTTRRRRGLGVSQANKRGGQTNKFGEEGDGEGGRLEGSRQRGRQAGRGGGL